jgi:hypothetical protein
MKYITIATVASGAAAAEQIMYKELAAKQIDEEQCTIRCNEIFMPYTITDTQCRGLEKQEAVTNDACEKSCMDDQECATWQFKSGKGCWHTPGKCVVMQKIYGEAKPEHRGWNGGSNYMDGATMAYMITDTQCNGLTEQPENTSAACEKSCLHKGEKCGTWQFHTNEGCWQTKDPCTENWPSPGWNGRSNFKAGATRETRATDILESKRNVCTKTCEPVEVMPATECPEGEILVNRQYDFAPLKNYVCVPTDDPCRTTINTADKGPKAKRPNQARLHCLRAHREGTRLTTMALQGPTVCDAGNCINWNCNEWCKCFNVEDERMSVYADNDCKEDDGKDECTCFVDYEEEQRECPKGHVKITQGRPAVDGAGCVLASDACPDQTLVINHAPLSGFDDESLLETPPGSNGDTANSLVWFHQPSGDTQVTVRQVTYRCVENNDLCLEAETVKDRCLRYPRVGAGAAQLDSVLSI